MTSQQNKTATMTNQPLEEENLTARQRRAVECFNNNMHCSQSVLYAFAEECGITEEMAFRLGSCFGSGMRKGNVCGACAGALMVLGLLFGESHMSDKDERQRSNQMNDEMMNRFAQANGTCICNDLLGCDIATEEGRQYARSNGLFKEFCPKMVASAVGILEDIIREMNDADTLFEKFGEKGISYKVVDIHRKNALK